MIVINNLNAKRFTLNGIAYFKNYISRVVGNKIEIFNCYERSDVLVPLTHYNQFEVNSIGYESAATLQTALLDVIYTRVFNAGDTTLLNQNNIGYTKTYSLPFSMPRTREQLVQVINSFQGFTVTENQTPVIFYEYSGHALYPLPGSPLVATKKHSWLFLGGAGSWGNGSANTDVVTQQFYELPVQKLTPDDIQENENTSVTDLGNISSSGFLTVMNSVERNLSDSEFSYFFKYYVDDVLYVQQFIGTNQVYGGTSGNTFVEADFYETTNSNVPPSPQYVQQFATLSGFPATGEVDVIYIDAAENKLYRWDEDNYVQVGGTEITIDDEIIEDSTNPVAGGAVFSNMADKLNKEGNPSLSGNVDHIAIINQDGKITTDDNVYYNPITKVVYIGTESNPGRLDIASNQFKLKVQNNIASGNAIFEFNAGQEQALQFVDTNGVNYVTFKSINDEQGVILMQRQVISRSVFYDLQWEQAALTTAGAGVKVYGKDSLGNNLTLTLNNNGQTIQAYVSFIIKNVAGSEIISGDFKPIIARIADNNLVISDLNVNITSNHTNTLYHDWLVGVEHIVGTNTIRFYFTPGTSDSTTYTGAFTEIKYCIN